MTFEYIFPIFVVFFLLIILFVTYKKTGELVTPWVLFLGLAIIDIFLPGFLFVISPELPDLAPWVQPITHQETYKAMLFFLIGIVFFGIGYFGVLKIRSNKNFSFNDVKLRVGFIYFGLIVSGGIYFLNIANEVNKAGSVSNYISNKLYLRWTTQSAEVDSMFWGIISKLSPTMLWLFITLIGVLFFFRKEYNRPILWGVLLPLLGWLFATTTFFRGTQLNYFLGLFVIEMFRIKYHGINPATQITVFLKKQRKVIIILLVGVIIFTSYGTIRNYYSAQEHDNYISAKEAVAFELNRYFKGSSLVGLTSIMNYYPEEKGYFNGKTIIDMLLLPVPRVIYTSKPEWYGIDDITRGMGWPNSTQSAVSMPGELYANFGPVGVIFMMVFGGIFGLFSINRASPRMLFIYAFVFLPLMFVAFWMSLTGIMNGLVKLPIIYLALLLVIRKKRNKISKVVGL